MPAPFPILQSEAIDQSAEEIAEQIAPHVTDATAGWLLFAAVILGAVGIFLLLRRYNTASRYLGMALATVGVVLLAAYVPMMAGWGQQIAFWILAGTATVAGIAMVSSRSPVYSAIWFALVLLMVAGLFLLLGAQFLGVATVVVYAGAIVVTFLFVLMLAQPQGHDYYDRVSWGWFPIGFGSLIAVLIVAGVALSVTRASIPPGMALAEERVTGGVQDAHHMAHLGGELFTRHLISVEIAGVLLLVALVGAIAIVLQGRRTGAEQSVVQEGRFWNE